MEVLNKTTPKPEPSSDKQKKDYPITKEEASRLRKQVYEATGNIGLLKVQPANKWIEQAKTRPIPKMLFGEFWFEGEIGILFADTNLGKSILAVQISNSISKGEQIPGFVLEALMQLVLYFDFELFAKQFENRYSEGYSNHYVFDKNFIRIEINPDAIIPEHQTFEKFLNDSLEHSVIETGAKVLIIDNLTYLGTENEKAKDALPLMKHLKSIKTKYGLSILCLAHTPKRDLSKPLTRNDLQGSKMLINFCDSAFTIGESYSDTSLRYLKQIKSRNTEIIYDAENVINCQIEKPTNFLQFAFLNYGSESEHLKPNTPKEKEKIIERVKELSLQGKKQRAISRELGISVGSVNKYLKNNDVHNVHLFIS